MIEVRGRADSLRIPGNTSSGRAAYLTNYLLPTEHTYSEMEMKSIEGTNQESTKSGIERGR